MAIKLYYGKARKGYWIASTDESKLKMAIVYECEVETIHNNRVYMISCYKGFDYNYGGGIYDSFLNSELFHSVSAAKKSSVWRKAENLANANPDKYHVTPFSIASDDYGEPFIYGDCMQGKFHMKIIKVNVI